MSSTSQASSLTGRGHTYSVSLSLFLNWKAQVPVWREILKPWNWIVFSQLYFSLPQMQLEYIAICGMQYLYIILLLKLHCKIWNVRHSYHSVAQMEEWKMSQMLKFPWVVQQGSSLSESYTVGGKYGQISILQSMYSVHQICMWKEIPTTDIHSILLDIKIVNCKTIFN